MKEESVAAVFNCIDIVVIHFPEPVCITDNMRIMCKELRVHEVCCFFFEDFDLSEPAFLKMGDHEAGHIGT